MVNKILGARRDKSIAEALAEALKAPKYHGRIPYAEVMKILSAASDGDKITDVEFRDLKRILRTQKLWGPSRRAIQAHLELYYPLTGPFVYPGNVVDLQHTPRRGNQQCAALIQHTIPIGVTASWREGIPVKGNDHLIKEGTAIATFEDGFYPGRKYDNHVAYYMFQRSDGVAVMDQYKSEKKPKVSARLMPYKGKWSNGMFKDPSNNGDALSVIMWKA